MYGQTECHRISYLPPNQIDERPGSVGIAIPNSEVFIVDDRGRRVPRGTIGELIVRGPHVMKGYWNKPALTAAVLRPFDVPGGPVYYTGDLFRMDKDGFLYFVDRGRGVFAFRAPHRRCRCLWTARALDSRGRSLPTAPARRGRRYFRRRRQQRGCRAIVARGWARPRARIDDAGIRLFARERAPGAGAG